MEELNVNTLTNISGGSRSRAGREIGKWIASSAAWQGVTSYVSSISRSTSSGGQMNRERRQNMHKNKD
jgi:hypothetical protein